MVYSVDDIKHLEMMKDLEDRALPEVNVKTLLGIDAAPQSSFDQSILKLCQELRTKGFERHAASLENKFLALKTAKVHLYRAHDEDGEDLVHSAHPDGDVNMGDGELGDVETTVSKHKKIVDIVNKQPTGKLASYITQCKMVLGQDAIPTKPTSYEEVLENMRVHALTMANTIDTIIEEGGELSWLGSKPAYEANMYNLISTLGKSPIRLPGINFAIKTASYVMSAIKGAMNPIGGALNPWSGESKGIIARIVPAYTELNKALMIMRGYEEKRLNKESIVTNKVVTPEDSQDEQPLDPDTQAKFVSQLKSRLDELKAKYNAKADQLKYFPAQKRTTLEWFAKEEAEVLGLKTQKEADKLTSEINNVASQVQ